MAINKTIASLVIIALLTSAGLVSQVAQGDVYYCEDKQLVMQCARFSESGLRCYPSLTDTKGYKDCSDWEKVVDEVEVNSTIVQNSTTEVITKVITDLDSDYICIKNRVGIIDCKNVKNMDRIEVVQFIDSED